MSHAPGHIPPPARRPHPQGNISPDVELQEAILPPTQAFPPDTANLTPLQPSTYGEAPPQHQFKPHTIDPPKKGLGIKDYPIKNGKRDYSKSLAQIKDPSKQFDSNLTVCFRDITVTVKVPKEEKGTKTVITPCVELGKVIKTCGGSCATQPFYRIKDCSGIIRPSETTLVVGAPGCGKSTFLKTLANRIEFEGRVAYNGRSFQQAEAEGCDLKKMTQYVDQVDCHLPLLTVHETIDFAHQLTSVNYDPARVEQSLALLGLEECRNTIIGNALIRGVSGGQRKRVTSGELLVSDASILFLDEFSNGLDSSTSVDIMSGLKKFCLQYNSSIVATLQQPTPELFALFDRIVVLREGEIVYQGPTEDVEPYFAAMGYRVPDDVDTADFLIDCLSQPRSVILRQRQEDLHQARKTGGKNAKPPKHPTTLSTTYGPIQASPEPCITTEQMVEYYQTTPQWKEIKDELDEKIPADVNIAIDVSQFQQLMPTEKSHIMYQLGYRLPLMTLLLHVLVRQSKLTARNMGVLIPRIFMAILMSLLYGSLYYHVKDDEYILRLAALLVAISQIAFANFIEIPVACFNQRVVQKQLSARFYPSWSYVISAFIMSIPLAIIEATIYALFLYFMTFAYPGALEFFTFWSILIIQSTMLGAWFRLLAVIGGDEQSSQSMAGPSTGLFLVFGGLFLARSSIPDFMIWLYWLSPFSWSVRCLANNEFLSPRYDQIVEVGGNFMRIGDRYLQQIDMYIGGKWILAGMGYLLGGAIILTIVNSYAMINDYWEESIGTRRDTDSEILDDESENPNPAQNDDELIKAQITAAAIQQAEIQAENSRMGPSTTGRSTTGASVTAGTSTYDSNALKTLRENVPFTPAWLSFSDVFYTVQVQNDAGQTVPRVLLSGVNGYAQPGKMLALMGASGAGKTTLLDVIAGLKNTGVVEGKININGQPTTPEIIAMFTGYVEQFDTLFYYSTVRETLQFAARCRLPRSVPDEIKLKIVDEIIDILELGSIANFIIGSPKIQSLSPAQAKRVNIGVELVANPSILFLDEPTTGLDSKSAQTVMQVVKRIARSGRSIICTIHQPSAELFYLFDRLLLLGQGGHQIYFGDLGRRGTTFVEYLSQCPGVSPIKPRVNPSNWMLEALGVGVQAEKETANEANIAAPSQQSSNPRFQLVEEPEWADLESGKRTVQKFKKLYKQSEAYEKTRARLNLLESIEIIDPNDPVALERYKVEAQQHQLALNKRGPADGSSVTKLPTTTVPIVKAEKLLLIDQFRFLFQRNFMAYWRNPKFIHSRLFVVTILSFIFGLLYLQIKPKDVSGATSLMGACFMGTIFSAITYCATCTPVLFEGRSTFYREKHSGYYRPGLYAPVALLIELIWMIYGATIPNILVYFMVGLYQDAGVFFRFCLSSYLLIAAYISVAMFFSSLAPNSQLAQVWQGAFFATGNALGGVAITLPNIPRGYIWLYRLLPGSHIFESIIMPQFEHLNVDIKLLVDGQDKMVPIKDFIADYSGWSYGTGLYWKQLGWCLLFIVVLQILSFLGSTFISHQKR